MHYQAPGRIRECWTVVVDQWSHPYPIYTIILLKSVCLSVGVRKRQAAILARSSRTMCLTVRIVRQYIRSQVLVSVRPRFFLYAKNPQNLGETWPPVPVFISKTSDPLLSPAELAVTVGCHQIAIQRRRCVCVWGCAGVRAGACARVCVRTRERAHACASVRSCVCVCNIR